VKNKQSIVILVMIGAMAAGLAVGSILGGCQPVGKSAPPPIVDESRVAKPASVVNGSGKPAQVVRPSPPDLTDCTRIEARYYPSTRWPLDLAGGDSILNSEESQYVDSLDKIVVEDSNRIRDLAEHLRSGAYEGSGYTIAMQRNVDVVCYRGEEHLTSFTQYGWTICTQEGHWFRYRSDPTPNIDPPELHALYLRGGCVNNLYRMGYELRTMAREGMAWPAPEQWCDVLPRRRLIGNPGAADRLAREFVCPGAGAGKCHYAMNPACKPDSPPDIVLLFETKAGWNQHGGRELFTFENHGPKGGCVLLNDGTIKFIRTAEELKQLRWNEWNPFLKIDTLLGEK
jgi:hypothetical protein